MHDSYVPVTKQSKVIFFWSKIQCRLSKSQSSLIEIKLDGSAVIFG